MCYHQMEGWNDAKHRDMSHLVTECVHAIDQINQSLVQEKKLLSILVNDIVAYEEIRLGGVTAHQTFVQSLRMSQGTVNNQYYLGVKTNGVLPASYIKKLTERLESAEELAKQVFMKYAHHLLIQDTSYPTDQIPHYRPFDKDSEKRGVYFNAQTDMNNPRGEGSTFFHELGHMLDHVCSTSDTFISNTEEFKDALLSDGEAVLLSFNNMSEDNQERFIRRIRQDFAHSFSDLIDATTNGSIHGRYGHSRDYWSRNGNLQAEAFAHFFEASMGGGNKLELLSRLFPTAFGVFNEMLENVIDTYPDIGERELRRMR